MSREDEDEMIKMWCVVRSQLINRRATTVSFTVYLFLSRPLCNVMMLTVPLWYDVSFEILVCFFFVVAHQWMELCAVNSFWCHHSLLYLQQMNVLLNLVISIVVP